MPPYTYTNVYTRAEVLVDQVDVFFDKAGIDESRRRRVCEAVSDRWLAAVGLFLERDDKLVYEIEATINWSAHNEQAELSFSTDLPGWENKESPEAVILGARFAKVAADEKLEPRFWVRFVESVLGDPVLFEQLCKQVGVGGTLPDWKKTPESRSLRLQDLRELGMTVRSAL